MAAHTPVIGLTAIVKSVSEERRVLGRGCGLRELIDVVCGYAKLWWFDRENELLLT
jgi:hypothetical protein